MTTRHPVRRGLLALVVAVTGLVAAVPAAWAAGPYQAVTGSGSTWSANMVEQWTADVKQFGISVSFSATGSSTGRREFKNSTADFAVTEIPYGLTDASGVYDTPPSRGYAYLPIVAGGTSFMYNLRVGGRQVTNLRLSGDVLAKIFTGVITRWNDPAIARDNPRIPLPSRQIVPVVRSDGSGTTAQFTTWLSKEHTASWNAFCRKQGITWSGSACPFTSNFPAAKGFVAQSGSLGVAGYVSPPSAEGAINYVEYSYALRAKFPVVKLLNRSGYYVEPTDQAVAVGLLGARINTDKADRDRYLTQILDGVYRSTDPRAYPLSSYSYVVIPTAEGNSLAAAKGRALGDFLYYSVCEGQQAAGVLGYSPLPQNLVKAGLEQIRLIPGVDAKSVSLTKCNNPTFGEDGTNTLARTAPQPPACDRQGPQQCATGTGGARGADAPAAARPGVTAGPAGGDRGTGTPVGGSGGSTGIPQGATATPGAGAAADPLAGVPGTAEVVAAAGTDAVVTGLPSSVAPSTGARDQLWWMLLAAGLLVAGVVGPAVVLARGPGARA